MHLDLLRSSSLRQAMVSFARRRGAGADAEDAVQATLTEAWQKAERPSEPEQLRRWLWGILRHKVVDLHRRRSREVIAGDLESPPEHAARTEALHAAAEEKGENDLLLWASRNLPQGKDAAQTLAWLLREAEGESLERIARDAALPAARVRKRVSRLREHFRLHWQRDLAALAALGIVAGLVIALWPQPPQNIARDPAPVAPDPRHLRALELHREAHQACARQAWRECIALLDEAGALGEPEPERAAADRRRAIERLAVPAPAPVPSASAPPRRPPRSTTPSPSNGSSW